MKRVLIATVAATLCAVVLGSAAARASDGDADSVRLAFRGGMQAVQDLFSVAQTVEAATSLPVGTVPSPPASLRTGSSQVLLRSTDTLGRAALAQYFVGDALTEKLRDHARMIAEQETAAMPGFTPPGGGVRGIDYGFVDVTSDTAEVAANVETWLSFAPGSGP